MLSLITRIAAAKIGDDNPILIDPSSDGGINWPQYVGVAVGVLLIVTAFSSMIYLIWGAIRLITSSNEAAKVEQGRRRMQWAVIGLLIAAASYAIWNLILQAVGLGDINMGGL